MPKIVPAGCFVPNTVDMTRSLFDWSNRGSFSKGKGRILSLTITFHTDLARGSQLLFDCHIFLLQMDPPATPTTVDAPPFFLTFSQPSVSEKQTSSAIVAHVLSSAGISVPYLGNVQSDSPSPSYQVTESTWAPVLCAFCSKRCLPLVSMELSITC